MEKESFHFLPLAAQTKNRLSESRLGSRPIVELLLWSCGAWEQLWTVQIDYCTKLCSENVMEKPLCKQAPCVSNLV